MLQTMYQRSASGNILLTGESWQDVVWNISGLRAKIHFKTFCTERVPLAHNICADGIFAFQSMFSCGQRGKCADLLNSYAILSIDFMVIYWYSIKNSRRGE